MFHLKPKPEATQVGRPGDTRPGCGFLGDHGRSRVEAEDHLVDLFEEIHRLEVLPAAEPVRHPLPLPAGVVEVEHRRHGVDPEAVDVVLLDPEQGVGDEEVADLVAAEVEYQRAPVGVLALAGVAVLVQGRPVEAGQGELVTWEVGRHPVDDHTDSAPVQGVDQSPEVVRFAEARRRRVVARHLVSPRSAEGVLGDRHELDVGEAHVGQILGELLGQLAVGRAASVLRRRLR